MERRANFLVCAFGTAQPRAVDDIALVGDSHASHWRSALRLVAQNERWHGLSVTHTGCPYSQTVKALARDVDCKLRVVRQVAQELRRFAQLVRRQRID